MNLKNLIDYCRLNNLPSPFEGAHVPAPLNLDTTLSAIMIRCGLLTPVYGEPDTFRDMVSYWFDAKEWTFEHLIKVIQSEYSPIENVFEEKTEKSLYNSNHLKTGGYKDTNSGKDTISESGKDQRDITESGTDQRDITESGTDQRDITESGTDQRDITESGTDQRDIVESGTDERDITEGGTENRDISNTGTDTTTNTISAFNASTYQPDNKTELQHGLTTDDDITFGKTVDDDITYGKTVDDDITYGKTVDDDITYGKTVDDDITYGKTVDDDITYGKSVDDDITYGKKTESEKGSALERVYNNEKTAHGGMDELIMSRHGNIGVTSAQELIEQELELLRHFDIYGYISKMFEEDNMIMVY